MEDGSTILEMSSSILTQICPAISLRLQLPRLLLSLAEELPSKLMVECCSAQRARNVLLSRYHTASEMLTVAVYVGENASLSFLQFLREVLKKHMGPTTFTENLFKDNMLEMEIGRDDAPLNLEQSRADKCALVQLYREASSGILDLFTVEEINTYLDRHSSLSPSNTIPDEDRHEKADQAALNMMLAIGSQCRAQNPFDSFNAARYFTSAQKFAFEGFLCDPSLDMIRVFLLMAFYMLGACHRNAAFMYLGIASKAACALGLHRNEQDKDLSRTECLMR